MVGVSLHHMVRAAQRRMATACTGSGMWAGKLLEG